MEQKNKKAKALSVVMSATLAATFGMPALAAADEATASSPEAIEWSAANGGVQQDAPATALAEQEASPAQAKAKSPIKVGETYYSTL